MALGLVSTDDGRGGHLIPFIGTGLRVHAAASEGESGITGWTLAGSAELDDDHRVDGLSTSVVDGVGPVFADHPLGAVGLDHVVVSTDDLERTTGAITAATGAPLKRIRELGSIRQGFHRIGPAGLIVEVVEHADSPPGPASFWGVVINVEDLDAACELIGPDLIGPPKDAVQPDRRIATIRREAGLGTAVALMTQ
ncbi:MAG: glyoxalase [Actinomycetota bacterium]